jgi:prevent-host-death family protein
LNFIKEQAMHTWQIQQAKTHFSELVRATEQTGPQAITWHGRSVAVVLSSADYARLTGNGQSLVDFMQQSPLVDAPDIDLARDNSSAREVIF